MISPKSKPSAARPKARPKRFLKHNINFQDLDDQARLFYAGINWIMERLYTLPRKWYAFCMDEDTYPSDLSNLIKVIPPACSQVVFDPDDYNPVGRLFINYDDSMPTDAQIHGFLKGLPPIPPPPTSLAAQPEAGPSKTKACVASPSVGPSKKCLCEPEDPDPVASDAGVPSEDEVPASKPKASRALRTKRAKTDEGSPISPTLSSLIPPPDFSFPQEPARPSKKKKSKGKAKEEAASNKIPDAPHCRNCSLGAKVSCSDKDPDATKISKLIAAHVQKAKGEKAGTPGGTFPLFILFESLELIDVQKILEPEEPCAFCILHRVDCISIAFGHGCLNCFLKGFHYCCHAATMSELIKFHMEFADRFAVASHTTEVIVDQFQWMATCLDSVTSLYNDVSIHFAEVFDHLVRHFNACAEKLNDETFASWFSDSSLAVRNHLADLVAQFRGTFKSFKNLDMSDIDFEKQPCLLSTNRALIDIAQGPSESVKAVDVDADGEEEVESEEVEEVEERRLVTLPKPAPKPSSRLSTAKPSSTPKKPASKPSPARPLSTRSRVVPKGQE
ncbi:hypothetical protein DFH07DRAFT_963452 [Mycena maculata]|uniref:Uncharacterized protein n=1 Tax=Mycena maculata TaxID=230809 RepID=A0AAD7IN56_9AGAR|nr:hypothetical protein DFH07DRAFT_963452 [Mycena maculata]